MKAQERHKLKTNELAQFISELPAYFQKHASKITTIALVVVIALAGGIMARRYFVQGKQQQQDQLFQQLLAADTLQLDALRRVQMGAELASDPANAILPYDTTSITLTLSNIAQDAPNNPVGMTAGLLQAELSLSQLYFSDQNITEDQKKQLLQTAENLYRQALVKFPTIPYAVGTAKIGLATVAEERGQWEQARTQFTEIIALKDELLVGTIYPKLAQRRLALLDTISTPITFPEIKPVHPADFAAPDLLPNLTDLPPLKPPAFDPNFIQPPMEIAPPISEPNKITPTTQIPVIEPNKIELPPQKIVTDPNKIKLPMKIPVTEPNIIK